MWKGRLLTALVPIDLRSLNFDLSICKATNQRLTLYMRGRLQFEPEFSSTHALRAIFLTSTIIIIIIITEKTSPLLFENNKGFFKGYCSIFNLNVLIQP